MTSRATIGALSICGAFLLVCMALPLSQARNMISNGRLIAAADTAGEKMGVTDNEVLIGSCCSLSGNLAERGHQLAIGAQSYLQSINEQGGVNGRKIKLSQCDDKYDPEAAIGCFNTCLKDKIFAGAFFVGSPPISKYVRMGDANHIPLLGFCTGTPVIYEQHGSDCHHFILRRGYADEVDKQIKELYKNRGIRKFAIVYQSDAFGAAVRESALKALKGYGVQPVVEASYSRRTQDIEDAYKLLRQNHPEVVILGATSDAFKGLVKRKNDDKWNAVFVGLSVDDDYVGELGAAADGMILTQVVPLMDDHSLPAVKLFEKLHAKYEPGAQVAATAFEAFLNAEVLAEALKRSGHDLTRSGFVKALESMHGFDIGAGSEFKVSFSPSDHVGWPTGSVFLTIVKDGKPVVIHEADWKAALKSIKSGT